VTSAASKSSTEAQVRAVITRFAPDHPRLVAALRRALRKRLPTAYEIAYEYRDWFVITFSPNEHGYAGLLSIRGDADGVKLYFNISHGLPDPEKLLKGTGKQTRWIAIDNASALKHPAIAALIDETLTRNPLPFPAEGRGRVVIRS
jgi:hypothetical protein